MWSYHGRYGFCLNVIVMQYISIVSNLKRCKQIICPTVCVTILASVRFVCICLNCIYVLKFFFSVPFCRRRTTATALSWLQVALDRVEERRENRVTKTSPPPATVDPMFMQRLTLTHTATTTSRLPRTSSLLTRVVATSQLRRQNVRHLFPFCHRDYTTTCGCVYYSLMYVVSRCMWTQ